MTTLAERVRDARGRTGFNQAELARSMNASINAINMIEQGKITDPHASRIVALAVALGVSTDWLLGLAPYEGEENHG